jgi:crossover junction endodeoxyribonuclease RuvC
MICDAFSLIEYIAGIDPGQKGCLCLRNILTHAIHFFDMPLMEVLVNKRKRERIDYWALKKIFEDLPKGTHIFAEDLWGFGPTIDAGGAGQWNYAQDYGALRASLVWSERPFTLVTPQVWQKATGSVGGKQGSILRALQSHPGVDLIPPGCRTYSDGRAESLLMTDYGLMKLKGEI